eukprot:4230376-Pleurochrysis_carterae.AAC.2
MHRMARLEQIVKDLVVNLHERAGDQEALVRRLALGRLDHREELVAQPRDQPAVVGRAHHRVGLARPRLAIGEDGR